MKVNNFISSEQRIAKWINPLSCQVQLNSIYTYIKSCNLK